MERLGSALQFGLLAVVGGRVVKGGKKDPRVRRAPLRRAGSGMGNKASDLQPEFRRPCWRVRIQAEWVHIEL